jgi:NhaP-type Na+/H+ or K+/H+ antiporter
MSRELIVSITYIVVVRSILVQAMSIAKLVKKIGVSG